MAAETHYNDNGTWRKLKEVHYNDNGTWRKLKEVWYNDNGTWRKVFSGEGVINPQFPGYNSTTRAYLESAVIDPSDSQVYVWFNADGTFAGAGVQLATNDVSGKSWYDPTTAGIGASYYGCLLRSTGDTLNYGTMSYSGGFTLLSANKYVGYSRTTIGVLVGTFTTQIATDSGGTNIVGASATGCIQVEAFVDS